MTGGRKKPGNRGGNIQLTKMKALLLDVDGVLIRSRHKYFSEKYSEEYKIPIKDILPFFKNEYKLAAVGKLDIREVLPKYLDTWGWNKSVDNFLQYWFESEREKDTDLIQLIQNLRSLGVKVYIASNNEARRAKYLMEKVGFDRDLDGAFFSAGLGVVKSDPDFFEKILSELKLPPAEVTYFDSDEENAEVAKNVGVNSFVYTNFSEFEKIIKNLSSK